MANLASDLFNSRTIARMSSGVKVTLKQKYNAHEWIRLLESGALGDEKKNYIRFANMVLQDILGYSDPDFEVGRVEFSFRNPSGDGGVCVEVKGTTTRDLFAVQNREKPEHRTPINQTWDYMGSGNFDYGIATNYRDFVLIDKMKGYSRYHLFDFMTIKADESKLKEFIAVFSKTSIIDRNFIPKLYYESSIEERIFTAEFYKLYHETRLMLLREFVANGKITQKESLHYAQLLLNRLIFVFFAQGTGKLRRRLFAESILPSLNPALVSEYSHYASDTILNLFERLDKGSKEPVDIFGFNGGLFRDRIPPDISFRDMRSESFFKDILLHSTLKKEIVQDEVTQSIIKKFRKRLNPIIGNLLILSSFDFQSEVNVNILGHIFEQSLTDLEELQGSNEISKRKKEGIFYTPEYITDYICRNTILPYFSRRGAVTVDEVIGEYANDIDKLEERFRRIKILDPACGSGAFLLKAVSILLEVHKAIRVFKESKGGYTATVSKRKRSISSDYFKLEKWNEEEEARTIIENNIFGVDVNEESVEITKLSLFLKIASNNKKLIDLSANIRVGNSLIEDSNVDPKAFRWEEEFKTIFDAGGFDVVIGNPPYVRVQNMEYSQTDYLFAHYPESAHKKFDISLIFFQKCLQLLKSDGYGGLISSSQWMNTDYGEKLRELLAKGYLHAVVDFGSLRVFAEASTYPAIFLLRKEKGEDVNYRRISESSKLSVEGINSVKPIKVPLSRLGKSSWSFSEFDLVGYLDENKISHAPLTTFGHFYYGIVSGLDDVFIVDDANIEELKLEREFLLPYAYQGDEVYAFRQTTPSEKIIYPYKPDDAGDSVLLGEGELSSRAPNLFAYLKRHKELLSNRMDSRKYYARKSGWYRLVRPGRFRYIRPHKLIVRGIAKRSCVGFLAEDTAFSGANTPAFIVEMEGFDWKYFLAILNSKVVSYYLQSICPPKLQNYYRFNANSLNTIPIPRAVDKEKITLLVQQTEKLIQLYCDFEDWKGMFMTRVATNLGRDLVNKLDNFYQLKYDEFMSLVKQEIGTGFSLKAQDEWQSYFEEYRSKLVDQMRYIEEAEDALNEIVYGIYGINQSDTKVIEEGYRR